MNSLHHPRGRGVFYSRDSGGKHEQTPPEYVAWAAGKCREFGIAFEGTSEEIMRMIQTRTAVSGDLYLDYCVEGDTMDRPALRALLLRLSADKRVSHLLIPKRNRLSRPGDPTSAVLFETQIRRCGVCIVYTNEILEPLARGERVDIGQLVTSLVGFDNAGKFLDELAEAMINSQLSLAKQGFSTGGRAPYGFYRALVGSAGDVVRRLADGERVRMPGHHVAFLPDPVTFPVVRRILEMLETMPASRVAATLSTEGIPSPDKGRYRKDCGVLHQVGGLWHSNTVTNVARNALLLGEKCYGRRGMGKVRRMTPNGPRMLQETDFREEDKRKVVANRSDQVIVAPAACGSVLVDPEKQKKLLAKLDERGGTQRGKPRARDPEKNPLGSRIFDMACGWPMYRTPRKGSFRYECGLYQQSHGAECSFNHVDGPKAASHAFAAVRQKVLRSGAVTRLTETIRRKLEERMQSRQSEEERAVVDSQLASIECELALIKTNMGRAKSEEQFNAIAAQFDDLSRRRAALIKRLDELASQTGCTDVELVLQRALQAFSEIQQLAGQAEDLAGLTRLFDALNVQLFMRFQPVQKKKRVENKLAGGVITWGSAESPIQKYAGPTGRRALKTSLVRQASESAIRENSINTGGRNGSLGNVSRGDRI